MRAERQQAKTDSPMSVTGMPSASASIAVHLPAIAERAREGVRESHRERDRESRRERESDKESL